MIKVKIRGGKFQPVLRNAIIALPPISMSRILLVFLRSLVSSSGLLHKADTTITFNKITTGIITSVFYSTDGNVRNIKLIDIVKHVQKNTNN